MKTGEKRRMGRPTKSAQSGGRVALGLRVSAEIKNALDAAAQANGRSQSQEAEVRLNESFNRDSALGGANVGDISLAMAAAFGHAGAMSARADGVEDWIKDPAVYRRAATAVVEMLYRGFPSADQAERRRFRNAIVGSLDTMWLNDQPEESKDE